MPKLQQSRKRSTRSKKQTPEPAKPDTQTGDTPTAESQSAQSGPEPIEAAPKAPAAKPAKPRARRASTPRPPKTARVSSRAADYSSSVSGRPSESPQTEPPPAVIVGEPIAETPTTPKTKPRTRRAPAKKTSPSPEEATPTVEATVETEVIDTTVVEASSRPTPTPTETEEARATNAAALAPSAPAPSGEARAGDLTGLRILMIASEAVPFAKTGGLADVAGALPVALGRLGHDVTLVLPRYRGVQTQGTPIASVDLLLGPDRLEADVYQVPLGRGARAWLIDAPALYDREGLYGANNTDHPDNPRRFAFLVRAAFEAARTVDYEPDVVHAHDWQAGLAPVYLRTYYANDRILGGVPSVFTIHNIAYTGTFDPSWMPVLDLGWELFRPESLEYWSRISFLKAGINFSTKITTVSPTYAREILTPQFAYGFEGILAARRADLVGILNGIDADAWNPGTDPHIPKPYSIDDLSGKREAKRALLETYALPWDDDAMEEPLIGMVSRMIDQKGLDMIASISHELPTVGARFVILGTGEPRYEEMWRGLANRYPDRIAVKVGFDEPLAHLVEAGADLFLMPSRYEPCGLNQMYSLRYGTLPLVRATGGLDDTVENYDPYTDRGNGFKFWEPSGPALLNTLRWALRVYERPDIWQRLQRAGMQLDFSWSRSAGEYARLYTQVLATAGRTSRAAAAALPPT